MSWSYFSFRCCSASNIVGTKIIHENNKKDREQITCPSVGSQVQKFKECSDGSFQEIILDSSLYSIDSTSNTVTIQNQCDQDEPPIVLNQNDNNFCVRYNLNLIFYQKFTKQTLIYAYSIVSIP